MTLITHAVLARAIVDINGMSAAQKMQLADEIYVRQPNLPASILVLPRFGVSTLELEVPIHVLLVTYQAIKRFGLGLQTITKDTQDICMQRLTATLKFTEGVPPELVSQMIMQLLAKHPERYLLAFVYGYLGDHDLLSVRTEAEKFLLLACLNLVESISPAPQPNCELMGHLGPAVKVGRLDAHIERAVPLEVVQTQSGHANLSTTMNIYAKAPLQRKRPAIPS